MMQSGQALPAYDVRNSNYQPLPQKKEDDEVGDIASFTQEDIEAAEKEVSEAEHEAKKAAKESGSYIGTMARFSAEEGYGFIACQETVEDWDRKDIFIANRNFYAAKVKVG